MVSSSVPVKMTLGNRYCHHGRGNLKCPAGAGMDYTAFTFSFQRNDREGVGTDGDWLKVILPENG